MLTMCVRVRVYHHNKWWNVKCYYCLHLKSHYTWGHIACHYHFRRPRRLKWMKRLIIKEPYIIPPIFLIHFTFYHSKFQFGEWSLRYKITNIGWVSLLASDLLTISTRQFDKLNILIDLWHGISYLANGVNRNSTYQQLCLLVLNRFHQRSTSLFHCKNEFACASVSTLLESDYF